MDINFGRSFPGLPSPVSNQTARGHLTQQNSAEKQKENEISENVNGNMLNRATNAEENSYFIPQTRLEMPIVNIRNVEINENKIKTKFYFEIPYDDESESIIQTVPNFMSIKIVKVQDAKLFSFLNLSKQLVMYSSKPANFKNLPTILLNIAKEIGLTEKSDGEQLAEIIKNPVKIQNINFSISNNISLSRKIIMPDGKIKIDMQYEVELPIDNTGHLSLFIYPQLDESRLKEANIQYDPDIKNIKVNSEIIINNNKKISQTYAYFLTNQSTKQRFIWPGFVHQDTNNGSWKTGRLNDKQEFKKSLTREIYFNTKIKDNLIFKKMQNIPLVSSVSVPNISNVVSPIRLNSITPDGISILINTELLLEKHSSAYKKVGAINLKNSDILQTIKIYKKRVKKQNNEVVDYGENEEKQYLPKEAYFIDNTNPINIITFLDEEDKIGKYCYGIEVTFKDIIINEIKSFVTSLRQSQAFLKTYLIESQTNNLNYDWEKECFTDQFKQKYMENREIQISVEKYIEGILKICTISNIPEEYKKQIILHISPKYGTPSGINQFLNLYQSLIDYYQDMISKASRNLFLTEEKYFNNLEQIVEYSSAEIKINNQNEIYGNFLSNNKISIKKQTSPDEYEDLFIKDKNGKLIFWDSMQESAKKELTDWISSIKNLCYSKPYNNRNQKYENAISALTTEPVVIPPAAMVQQPNILFNSTKKANKIIEEQYMGGLFFSINETPKKSTTGNVSDLKINEVMDYSAKAAKGGK